MQIPAKADYALRALLELTQRCEPATAESIAQAQQLPKGFAALILNDLRRGGLLTTGGATVAISCPDHRSRSPLPTSCT